MRIIGLLMLMCLSVSAHAVVVSDLYQVRVPVADQSQGVRNLALRQAYQQVIIKVSGTAQSMQNPLIQTEANKADALVTSFRYVRVAPDNSLQLEIQFAQNLVENLLIKAGEPIWGKSRPLVMMWLAVEKDRTRNVIGQKNEDIRLQMDDAMTERGVPVLWPILDIEDQASLPIAKLWGLFRDDIKAASKRYMADAYVAGRLVQLPSKNWQYTGFLTHKNDTIELNFSDADLSVLMHKIADTVADYLGSRYAVRSNQAASGYQIQVTGINDFKRYNEVMAYLKANVAIKQVRVLMMSQETLMLELELAADWAQVWSTLSLDRRLRATEQEQVYYWHH